MSRNPIYGGVRRGREVEFLCCTPAQYDYWLNGNPKTEPVPIPGSDAAIPEQWLFCMEAKRSVCMKHVLEGACCRFRRELDDLRALTRMCRLFFACHV